MYQRSLSAGAYATLAGTDPLALGAGYWIKSLQASVRRPVDGRRQRHRGLERRRADAIGAQVVLTWDGGPAILANSRLTDGTTVIDPANYPNGYPLTLSGKVRRLVWEYLGVAN